MPAPASREINAAFATFVRERPDALFVGLDPFLNSRRAQSVNLASRHALPATFSNRDDAEIGGLMSYGANIADAYRQVGVYAGRLLKADKPADLPILQATRFEQRRKAEGEEIPIRGEECGEGGLAVSDHAAAERPSSAMNSRRFNCSTSHPGRPEGHGRTPFPALSCTVQPLV